MIQQKIMGRIVKSLGGFYYVAPQSGGPVVECRARGAFRQQNIKPCVGDWATVELTEQGTGYVVQLEPRSNSLVRPPLANLDQLVLVVSIADPAPNAFVLDKLIAIAEYQKIEPVIVITKCDLADPKEFADIYRAKQALPCMKRGRWSIRVSRRSWRCSRTRPAPSAETPVQVSPPCSMPSTRD